MAIRQTLINQFNTDIYLEYERLRQLTTNRETAYSGQAWRQFIRMLTNLCNEVVTTGTAGQIANAQIALTWIGELRARLSPWVTIDIALTSIFLPPLICPESLDISTAILELTAYPNDHPVVGGF